MKVAIEKLEYENELINKVKSFLFKQILNEYGYGYTPEYHQDIIKLPNYYLLPLKNNFFIATKHNKIIGTLGIRGYDKHFEQFENVYFKETTASLWRLFVEKKYRRKGIATKLVKEAEDFSKNQNYNNIYLHTHKNVEGALEFWKAQNYQITIDSNDKLKTVHMIKELNNPINYTILNNRILIKQ